MDGGGAEEEMVQQMSISITQALKYFASSVPSHLPPSLVDQMMEELRISARLGMRFEFERANEKVIEPDEMDRMVVKHKTVSKLRIITFPEHDPRNDIWSKVIFAYTIVLERVDPPLLAKMKLENRMRAGALAYHAAMTPTRRREKVGLGHRIETNALIEPSELAADHDSAEQPRESDNDPPDEVV